MSNYNTKIGSLREMQPPKTYAAEAKLLGTLICNSHDLPVARQWLTSADFKSPENAEVWEKLCEQYDKGKVIDIITMSKEVNANHYQQNILGWCVGSQSEFQIMENIDTLLRLSRSYDAYMVAIQALQAASQADLDLTNKLIVDYAAKAEVQPVSNGIIGVKEAINECAAELEEIQNEVAAGKVLRMPTGIPTLDWVTYGGFARGNLVILAARPSVGKTAIMLQMAHYAASSNHAAMVFSLEMTNSELVQRMVKASSTLSGFDMAQGRVDWNKFEEATGKFAELPLYFNDDTYYFDELCTKIRLSARQGKADIVFIDYLGLISHKDNRSTYQQVSECTKRLKRLAKDCRIPIVLLCQLNRDSSKDGRAPQLHDLRDSGSIEQDADIVLMLQREISIEESSRNVELYVRKNRQGRAGDKIVVQANDSFSTFEEVKSEMKIEATEEEQDFYTKFLDTTLINNNI